MKHATVHITDSEYNHFLELAKNLHYVKKIETDGEPFKEAKKRSKKHPSLKTELAKLFVALEENPTSGISLGYCF